MRFSTLYSSPQGCTCYDNKNSQCAPNYWCNECRNNPNNPNCNMRVGNQVVPRYQTQSGIGGIFATPTNRFRNAACSMFMGIDNGGFSMPMGISERANFQNANGSAEEIRGKQENPTRGLYGITIITLDQINDKMLYNVLLDAMRSRGLVVPMGFSPKLIFKGGKRGAYFYVFQIRNGLTAINFVIENREKRELEYSFINNFGQKVGRTYTAEFISGYLHSPKGGGGLPIGGGGLPIGGGRPLGGGGRPLGGGGLPIGGGGLPIGGGRPLGGGGRPLGGGFGNASGVIPPFPIVPTCPIGYAQKTYKYIGGKTRTICVPLPKKFVYSD